jgi:hypothetical protein
MKRLLVMVGLLVGLGLPQWSGAATIDDIRSADTVAIHEAVQSQLGALANDHASGAFEFATREKRLLIGSPDNFLRLVKEQYNPIYRYQRVLFSAPQLVRGNTVQVVCVTVVKVMSGWRFSGCSRSRARVGKSTAASCCRQPASRSDNENVIMIDEWINSRQLDW